MLHHLLRARTLRSYRSSVALEEETVWVAFYRRVADPAIAAQVIEQLDADADLKRTHPALYLRCKESLRKNKARLARTKRIRGLLRRMLRALRNGDKSRARSPLRHGTRVVVEALPKMTEEQPLRPDGSAKSGVTPAREPHFEGAARHNAKAA